jgi:long-chain acyl-CoA synthetase
MQPTLLLKDHGKTALIFEDGHIDYARILAGVDAYARAFRLRRGARACLYAQNCPGWIYALYAIWLHGGIAVPLDFTAPVQDLSFILGDATPAVIFSTRDGLPVIRRAVRAARIKTRIIILENIPVLPQATGREVTTADMDRIAVIMYTSGTTGRPKGVMLSFDNLMASIQGIASLGMLTREDIMLGLLPFHHIFPFQGAVLAPLYLGATIALVKNLTPDEILKTLQKHGVTMFLGVPKLYELFHRALMGRVRANPVARVLHVLARGTGNVRINRALFGKVHAAFGGHVHSYLTGGAMMDHTVMRDLQGLGFRLVEGYGLTETAPLVAFNPVRKIRPGSVGKPLAGTEVRLVDGEIAVRGRNVMRGYYRRPRETAARLRDGWFYTGDLGRFDRDGYLYIMGRKDDMIVLPSGKNVDPEEVEKKIRAISPLVKDIGVMQKDGRLLAVIQPDFSMLKKENVVNVLETLKWKVLDRYNASVASYKRILRFTLVRNDLPRTRLGKIKRFMLAQFISEKVPDAGGEGEPAFREYRVLAGFLEKQSGMRVRRNHHLEFDLGLDSLAMVELMAFIESAFGIPPGERLIASHPTVGDLAEAVRTQGTRAVRSVMDWRHILSEHVQFTVPRQGRVFMALRKIARPVFMVYFRLKFRGLEHLPDSPFIITPNHQSLLDAMILSVILPDRVLSRTYFVARESLRKSRIVRFFIERGNVIFINIESDLRGALQRAAAVLKAGSNLVIFPEGHRSRDGRVGQFKKAFAILSAELGIPVIPVAIRGTYRVMEHTRVFPRPGLIEFEFCRPEYPGHRDYQSFAERIRGIVKKIVERGENLSREGSIND